MIEAEKPSTRKAGEKVWCERGGTLVTPLPGKQCMMGYQVWVVKEHDGSFFTECEDRLRDVLRAEGDCDKKRAAPLTELQERRGKE